MCAGLVQAPFRCRSIEHQTESVPTSHLLTSGCRGRRRAHTVWRGLAARWQSPREATATEPPEPRGVLLADSGERGLRSASVSTVLTGTEAGKRSPCRADTAGVATSDAFAAVSLGANGGTPSSPGGGPTVAQCPVCSHCCKRLAASTAASAATPMASASCAGAAADAGKRPKSAVLKRPPLPPPPPLGPLPQAQNGGWKERTRVLHHTAARSVSSSSVRFSCASRLAASSCALACGKCVFSSLSFPALGSVHYSHCAKYSVLILRSGRTALPRRCMRGHSTVHE